MAPDVASVSPETIQEYESMILHKERWNWWTVRKEVLYIICHKRR